MLQELQQGLERGMSDLGISGLTKLGKKPEAWVWN